jgi:hypothetical protein
VFAKTEAPVRIALSGTECESGPVVGGDMKENSKADEIEELPDAWERFEKAFDTVMKVKPKPRAAKTKERPASKGRAHKGKTHR